MVTAWPSCFPISAIVVTGEDIDLRVALASCRLLRGHRALARDGAVTRPLPACRMFLPASPARSLSHLPPVPAVAAGFVERSAAVRWLLSSRWFLARATDGSLYLWRCRERG